MDISKPMLDGPVNDRAFLVHGKYTVGAKCSEKAAHTANHRSVKNIVAAVLDAGNIEQQRLALRDALGHPDVKVIASSIGLNTDRVKIALDAFDNLTRIVEAIITASKSKNGGVNTDVKAFLLAIAMCINETPPPTPEAGPSSTRRKKSTNISENKFRSAVKWKSKGSASWTFSSGKKGGGG